MAGFSVRASIHLQHRVFSISWLKKSSVVVTCLKVRDYNSSGPVRYIPKTQRSLNDPKPEIPPTTEIIDGNHLNSGLNANALKIEIRHRGAVRRNNFSDEKFCYQNQNDKGKNSTSKVMQGLEYEFDDNLGFVDEAILQEAEEVVEESGISKKKSWHDDQELQSYKSEEGAEKSAIELLAKRAFTAVEMRKKLLGKRFSPDTVEGLINDFKSRGLINDNLYAEAFSRSRWSSSSWGPRRIKQALTNKGIGGEVAQKAIKLVFEDDQTDYGMCSSSVSLSKVSMDHLFLQASKQWLRGQDAPTETRKTRIVRWLQYRGFDWEVVRMILKKLETEYPPPRL